MEDGEQQITILSGAQILNVRKGLFGLNHLKVLFMAHIEMDTNLFSSQQFHMELVIDLVLKVLHHLYSEVLHFFLTLDAIIIII